MNTNFDAIRETLINERINLGIPLYFCTEHKLEYDLTNLEGLLCYKHLTKIEELYPEERLDEILMLDDLPLLYYFSQRNNGISCYDIQILVDCSALKILWHLFSTNTFNPYFREMLLTYALTAFLFINAEYSIEILEMMVEKNIIKTSLNSLKELDNYKNSEFGDIFSKFIIVE